MRDIIVSLIIMALMPVCFRRPFIGLLVFSWLAYMRVQDLAWQFARGMRWSFYVFIITFAGYVVGPHKKTFFRKDPRCYWMIVLVCLVGIGIALSKYPNARQFSRYVEFVKIVFIALFTTALVTDRERLRVLMWVIAISMGFYGLKNGIWGILTLGRSQVLRGPGGMLADNNDFSLALSMGVPLLYYLGWTERRQLIKRAFWVMLPLTVVAVGLTHSRGGFLSVSTAIGIMVWRSRNRVGGLAVGFLVAICALIIAPASYTDRLMTIVDYENEGSASSRVRAWGIAIRMALGNPVFGVGFGKFKQHFLEFCNDPTPAELQYQGIIVAHNSYLQIWAECGTPAFLIYLGLILASFLTIWSVRRMAKQRYHSSWIINYANMFEASLATFMVGSMFLNRAHFDLLYHFLAIIMMFGHIATKEMLNTELYPARTAGTRGTLTHWKGGAFDRTHRRSAFDRRLVGEA